MYCVKLLHDDIPRRIREESDDYFIGQNGLGKKEKKQRFFWVKKQETVNYPISFF